jgi:hypothetical protein
MKYQVSQVQQWGEELDALSPPDPGSRMVGKREAVLLLAEKLQAAMQRGLSKAALLEALEARGLKVHVDLLREALKHGKASAQRPGRAPRRTRREAAAETGSEPSAAGRTDRNPAEVRAASIAGASSEPRRSEPRPDAENQTTQAPVKPPAQVGTKSGSRSAPSGDGQAARSTRVPTSVDAAKPSVTSPDRAESAGPGGKPGGGDKTGAAPTGRGSFIPRSDSDTI